MNEQEIRKDLIFYEPSTIVSGGAIGVNIPNYGQSLIILNRGFYEIDKDACKWVIKHEISHIKNHDHFTISFVPLVCQLASSIFGMYYLSFSSAYILALVVSVVSHSLFSLWREEKADDFAIENSSAEELKGGRRFFLAHQQLLLEQRNTFVNLIKISPNRDLKTDIRHPSITSGLQKIEKALIDRNISVSIAEEQENIDKNLKSHIINDLQKLQKFLNYSLSKNQKAS